MLPQLTYEQHEVWRGYVIYPQVTLLVRSRIRDDVPFRIVPPLCTAGTLIMKDVNGCYQK